jgi:hypothetical protein
MRISKRFTVAAMAGLAFVVTAVGATLAQSPTTTIAVVKDPGCTCCTKWAAHLEDAGYKVTVTESAEIDALKDSKGIPKAARSCHTAMVGGYVIEGHVPAADIKRLLKDHPDIVGLAVPGMVFGSPGMEVPSGRVDPYDVLAFDKAGHTTVFASHR